MNLRPTILLGVLAALALLVAAAPAGAASKASATKKPPKPNAAVARQIASLERATNTLSGEIAALSAQTATLEGSVKAPPAAPIAGVPTPAPPVPAGGDFSGSFPDPTLKPGTVGPLQLGEGSVTADKVADGSVGSATIAGGAITGGLLGTLSEADFGSALAGSTLNRRTYGAGESALFELGVPREQTLTLSAHCAGRVISGGWKLVPGELGAEVMASVPAFVSGGQSTEHDWTVTVHEQTSNTTVRNRMDMSGLCIE